MLEVEHAIKIYLRHEDFSVSVTGELEVQIHEPLSSPTEPEFLGYNRRNGFSHKGLIISYNK